MGLSTFDVMKKMNVGDGAKHLTDTQIKQIQNVLLGMLKDINNVCRKYNIRYALGGGSVLGAVRHNGFIPWDDDVDIDIERAEYEKFKEVFEKELGEKYWFHDIGKMNKLGLGFARIRKKGTIYRSREDADNEEAGIYIDMFIVENTYDSYLKRKIHGYESLAVGLALSCRNFAEKKKFYLDLAGDNKEAKNVFKKKIRIGKLLSFRSVEAWAKTWNKINKKCKNDDSKYVSVPVGRKHFFGELYERSRFCETVDYKFENLELPIPKEYDEYLKHMYGDYMKIPRKEDRESHVFLELKV